MRRALLLGPQASGLRGVGRDLAIMTRCLDMRGFVTDVVTGYDATRAGIVDRFERLIDETQASDSVVFYYSGLGGRVVSSGGGDRDLQYLAPTDIDESTGGDFRGITSLELSLLHARLAERTRNVTSILDCCYAARMSRNAQDFLQKARVQPMRVDVEAHIGRLRLPADLLRLVGNPDTVRLLACAPWEPAYEYTNADGERVSMMTEALGIALDRTLDAPVSWSVLVQWIRSRVQIMTPEQRPEVEGPAGRLVFDTAVADPDGRGLLAAVDAGRNRIRVPGAALLGVRAGDELVVTVPGGPTGSVIGTARVTGIDGVAAEANLTLRSGAERVPQAARVRPYRTVARPRPVTVHGTGERAEQVRSALDAVELLTPVEPGQEAFAEVTVGEKVVVHSAGLPVSPAHTADSAGVAGAIQDLTRLARADILRTMVPEPEEVLPDQQFTVEWGRVSADRTHPLEQSGEALHVGERVYVRLANKSDHDLYFTVFDIGVSGAISMVTSSDPSGVRVKPGGEYVVGRGFHDTDGAIAGTPLAWPSGVPAYGPLPETIITIVSSRRQDLSALEQSRLGLGAQGVLPRRSSLQRVAAQLYTSATREWGANVDATGLRYTVHRIDFMLVPADAPTDETVHFEIDERPAVSVRTLAATPVGPPAASVAPDTLRSVAVRILDLVIGQDKAVRGVELRVDALVLTRGPDSLPAYRAQTVRFSGVRPGDRLGFDNLLVYRGPAASFLDLAIWVSQDRPGCPALSEMLDRSLTADDVRRAAIRATGAGVAGQQAVAATMAVGSVSVIVNTANELLSQNADDLVGIYRTSLLAVERFGAGRHPAAGLRRARNVEFAYEITEISDAGGDPVDGSTSKLPRSLVPARTSSPERVISAWLGEPDEILTVGATYHLGIRIGSAHPRPLSTKPFTGIDQTTDLDIIVAVQGSDVRVRPAWRRTTLPVGGDTEDLIFEIEARVEGPISVVVTVHMARSLSRIDELTVPLVARTGIRTPS